MKDWFNLLHLLRRRLKFNSTFKLLYANVTRRNGDQVSLWPVKFSVENRIIPLALTTSNGQRGQRLLSILMVSQNEELLFQRAADGAVAADGPCLRVHGNMSPWSLPVNEY